MVADDITESAVEPQTTHDGLPVSQDLRFRCLQKVSLDPWKIGTIARACLASPDRTTPPSHPHSVCRMSSPKKPSIHSAPWGSGFPGVSAIG